MHKKVIFIIPGFRQKPTSIAYKKISMMLKNEGYFPFIISIPWKNSTISENTEYFLSIFNKFQSKEKYILGFSYGAMIAFIATTKVNVDGLILCSLSPYFNEDISKRRTTAQSVLMKMRYNDFIKFHAKELSQKVRAKHIVMLYGTQESRSLIKRVKNTFVQITSNHKQLIPIAKTEHEIGDKRYLDKIQTVSKELLLYK